jgi:hypothetical protein
VGHNFQLSALFAVVPVWIQEVINSYAVDSEAQQLLQVLAIHSPNDQGYQLVDGLIRYKGKIWVGFNTTIQTKIIQAMHCSAPGGHFGIQATYQRVNKLFCWKELRKLVDSFVRQCSICQQAKHENCKTPGLLSPLLIPQSSWQDIAMDFIDGLPLSGGYSVMLVVVDKFSKYAHFFPLKHPYTASSVATTFLNNIVKLHGLPKTIVLDRDKIFTSHFWKSLFDILGISLKLSFAYHPQTDGKTKRLNQCLEMYLRCAISSTPKQWVKWLPLAELWYNTSYHSALKCSLFKSLYGVDPIFAATPDVSTTDNNDVAQTLIERGHFSALLKEQLARAQNRMKVDADARRSERQFQVGEQVLLKLQPYA